MALIRAGGAALAALVVSFTGGPAGAGNPMPAISLQDLQGQTHDLAAIAKAGPATVLIFYSRSCPCFAAHRQEIADLSRRFTPRGVRFFLVDSEARSPGDEGPHAEDQALGIPILVDRDGALASALGAAYATYSVVVEPAAGLSYRGGIDSVREDSSPARKRYLRDALDAVLEHRPPPRAETKALGCLLRRR